MAYTIIILKTNYNNGVCFIIYAIEILNVNYLLNVTNKPCNNFIVHQLVVILSFFGHFYSQ